MLKLLIKGHERVAAGGRMELLLLLLMLLLVRRPVASRWTKAAWEKFLKKMPLVTNGMMRGGGCFGPVAAAASKRHNSLAVYT